MGTIDIWVLIWVVELAICCGLVLWRGGPVERTGAAIIFIAWLLSVVLQVRGNASPGIGVVLVDIGTLIALSILSARSRRLWTMFAVACQLDGVAAHFADFFSTLGPFGYFTALGIWSGDALIVCVISGVIGYNLRLRRDARMEAAGVRLPTRLRVWR
ncbi:hypothetical protein ATDW_36520 (plasmid) [Asticcacaulis sp. DW145]|uniref:hypothetical protein n=1 Tax=Asticcacaulis sp. DW145 TaxID=3095608 RepID=UPI003090D2CB|nr:hypothetical protein ATDW_36520 [Asticcacaulis sp. DW145]